MLHSRKLILSSLLGIFLLITIPFAVSFLVSHTTSSQETVVSPSPTLAPGEFPVLYSGVLWNAPNTGEITLLTGIKQTPRPSDIQKLGQSSTNFFYITSTIVPKEKVTSTVEYYTAWFAKENWTQDISAGGPTGEGYGFLKNGKRFLLYAYSLPHSTSYQLLIEHN